jgi:PAS domain S-box-containing protein
MGGGIWAMHFVAMLAFIFPLPIRHDLRLTGISLVLPIVASGVGFALVHRRSGRPLDIALGGLLVGGGIAAMHYTGIAAMRVPADLRYESAYVAGSVLIAIGAATFALWLSLRDRKLPVTIGAAVAMGLAVAGMHYTGMAAARWVPWPTTPDTHAGFVAHGPAVEPAGLATGVAVATFLILLLALVASMIDRRISALAERESALALRESEARAGALAAERAAILGQLAEGVIVTDLAGCISFVNDAAARIHGSAQLLGVPPSAYSTAYGLYTEDGRPYPSEELPLARAVLRGETVEGARWRIRRPDGTEVLAIGSARPVRAPDGAPLGAVLTLHDDTARAVAEAALRQSEERLRLAQEVTGVGVWEWEAASGAMVWTAENYMLLGLRPEHDGKASFERFLAAVHPDDQAGLLAAGRDAAETGALEVEFRVVRSRGVTRETRWLLSRARSVFESDAKPGRLLGVNIDITERKAAEERQALLMRELDHRAKNALAVVQATVRLTRADDPHALRAAIIGRIDALARAHTLLAQGHWTGANLEDLVHGELAAFLTEMPGMARVLTRGPAVSLAPSAVQALSMALHELATNATKHGALATTTGQVMVAWRVDPERQTLNLTWAETGGAPIRMQPARRGFGTRVLDATLGDQLGGRLERRWEITGLVCQIVLPLARILP